MFGPLVSSDVALTAYQTAVTWESLLSLLSCLNLHSPLGVLACDGGGLQENTSAALRAHVETVVVQALRKVRLDVSAATGRNIVSLIRVMLSSQVLAMCALYHAAALDAMLLECWLLVAAVHTVAPVVARGDVVAYLMQLLAAASARPEISAAGLEASVSAAALRALAALPMESATTFVTVVLQYLLVETAVPTPAISAGEGGDGMADERARAFCTRCLYQA
ncbi:hypothetical protein EON64_06310 [archaeon]|nr:MAG: hypothetical protein EON64_06310 [archaeon]